jgi:phosphomannomutase
MSISPTIFRGYDIRGEYPKELNENAAYLIGRAFIEHTQAKNVVVGGDMRVSTPALKEALIRGLREQGAHVTDIGLTTTDGIYFAAHHYRFEGAVMVTASHMPKEFNGLKFLANGLKPIGKGSGMEELCDIATHQRFSVISKPGKLSNKDIWADYKKFVLGFADVSQIKPLKVVMDAGNGMAGFIVDKVYRDLPIEIIPMFFEPDGNFPNHEANPIIPENRAAIVEKVKETQSDLGITWDADCDRVYFIDNNGKYIDSDFITVLIGLYIVEKNPGAGIVYDIRASHAVKDLIEKAGGRAFAERVGHSYIKLRMRQEDAEFGGEVSGHYYIKDNAYAENGFVPPLWIFEIISEKNKPISDLIAEFGNYHITGEINSTVKSTDEVIQRLAEKYKNANHIDYLDGITIEFADWHFNVRPSANDPVIRLNLEANNQELMEQKREEVLGVIRGQ